MNMDKLLASVKKHEGFRNKVYLDTLNKRTVGYGHLCVEDHWEDDKEYDEKYLEGILIRDLQNAIEGAEDLINNCPSGGKANISDDAKIIIIEMVFQLGKSGVSKFRNMWKALQQEPPQYDVASIEMLDSRWAKQTPNRAKEMAEQMKACG